MNYAFSGTLEEMDIDIITSSTTDDRPTLSETCFTTACIQTYLTLKYREYALACRLICRQLKGKRQD